MQPPENLKHLAHKEGGAVWLAALPQLVVGLAEDWGLQLGTPFPRANVSYVVAATRGTESTVLKIQWPHRECTQEAETLKAWNGDGAVRLLAHDPRRHALLLESCSPGTALSEQRNTDPLTVLIDLLPRLWKPATANITTLTEEARGWAETLHADWEAAGSRCERRLVDAASRFIEELSGDQGEQVLLHQDLHGDNILAAERMPWLAIDPKPLAGEREFALAPIIRSVEFGHSRDQVLKRLDRLTAELNLDRERARGWAVAQTLAWSFSTKYAERHYQTVRWLLQKEPAGPKSNL